MSDDIPENTEGTGEKEGGGGPGQVGLSEGDAGDRDSVDRIRDILFGAQARQYDQKIGFLEEMIGKEAARLREGTRQATETLEHYTKRELESLVAQLKAEKSERMESADHLAATIDSAVKAVERKINASDENVHAGHRDLQEQILQQSKFLQNEIQQRHDEILAALKKATDELRKEKTDRIALGNLFTEVGLRLKEEFKIPEGK